jgi:hypothetical protein
MITDDKMDKIRLGSKRGIHKFRHSALKDLTEDDALKCLEELWGNSTLRSSVTEKELFPLALQVARTRTEERRYAENDKLQCWLKFFAAVSALGALELPLRRRESAIRGRKNNAVVLKVAGFL